VTIVTAVLVKGIQESASFNATMVFLKLLVRAVRVSSWARFTSSRKKLASVAPFG